MEQIGEETMVYDEGLADRMRDAIGEEANLTAKRMMGGVCFLINGNMVSAAHREKTGEGLFMFRVGKENEAAALSRPGARPFAPGGRRMGGIIFVPEGDCDHRIYRHLAVEENMLEALGYVNAAEHKSSHVKLLDQLDDIWDDMLADFAFRPDDAARKWLESWLFQHVRSEDFQYRDWIVAAGLEAEAEQKMKE